MIPVGLLSFMLSHELVFAGVLAGPLLDSVVVTKTEISEQ